MKIRAIVISLLSLSIIGASKSSGLTESKSPLVADSHIVHLPIVTKFISEYDAFMALYNSTNGPEWHNNTGWGEGDPCDPPWYGVICEPGGWWLRLSNNNLVGSLPPELGSLTILRRLYLGGNYLTDISPELRNLQNLEVLNLDANQLYSIPPELGSLTSLRRLYLRGNHLTSIPVELGNLKNLSQLYLSDNQLTSVPPELGTLPKLSQLYLDGNQLTSIPEEEFSNLTRVWILNLEGNDITGSIQWLAGLKNLVYLTLSGNQFSGNIPDWFSNLSRLYALRLDSNNFSGVIPAELSNLDGLVILLLNGNPSLGCWETQAALDWAFSLQYCPAGGPCSPGYEGPTEVCLP